MDSLIRAEVSRQALRRNLSRVRELAPRSRVMAVVKANAYGHGLVPTALALDRADAFGVARLEEALALREAGIRQPVVLLEGVFDAEQLAAAARQELQLVVHEAAQLALLEHAPPSVRLVVWLKIDTGMNRLGFRSSDFAAAYDRLQGLGPRLAALRLMTHFASADELDQTRTRRQLDLFCATVAGLPNERSLANSAAVFACQAAHADWVRPGLALYGVSPFADDVGVSHGLEAAMRLTSRVISVREVPKGETVGYGGAWCAPRDSRIAIAAAGYGDGLPRSLVNGTPVLVQGQRATLAGRVSMDMIALDVTGLHDVAVGSPVLIWGPELPVEEVAAHAATIPYELLCGVSQRVPVAQA